MACGTPERGLPTLVGMFPHVVAGCFFRYLLYLAQQTMQRLLSVAMGEGSG